MIIECIAMLISVYSACINKQCVTACCINSQCSSNCTYLPKGEYCAYNSSCLSNYCSNHSCSDYAPNQCASHSMCASKCCSENYCLPSVYCSSLNEEGTPCNYDYQCKEDVCYRNYCDKDKSGLHSNSINCTNHSECISGCCMKLSTTSYCSIPTVCKHYATGEECYKDFECLSGYCYNEVCSVLHSASSFNVLIFIVLPIISLLWLVIGIILMLRFCKYRLMNDMERSPQTATKAVMVCPDTIMEGAPVHSSRNLA